MPVADLEEEINALVTTGLILKNDRNSLFTRNSVVIPTMDQENEFNEFDHNTDDETSENENVSTSID